MKKRLPKSFITIVTKPRSKFKASICSKNCSQSLHDFQALDTQLKTTIPSTYPVLSVALFSSWSKHLSLLQVL